MRQAIGRGARQTGSAAARQNLPQQSPPQIKATARRCGMPLPQRADKLRLNNLHGTTLSVIRWNFLDQRNYFDTGLRNLLLFRQKTTPLCANVQKRLVLSHNL